METKLTTEILLEHGFKNITRPEYVDSPYFVREGLMLFYYDYTAKFHVGFGAIEKGEISTVRFRWVETLEEVKLFYLAIFGNELTPPLKKTSDKWQREFFVTVTDPDGWDRLNFQYSFFEELITRDEFEIRLLRSTSIKNYYHDKEEDRSS